MFSEATPKPRMPSKRPLRSVLQVSPIEIARQLTLVEYDIFARIKPIVRLGPPLPYRIYIIAQPDR
jgi:hypothetical protein